MQRITTNVSMGTSARMVKESSMFLMSKAGGLVTMRRRLRFSAVFLSQSSMAVSLSTPLQCMDCKMGTGVK